MAKRFNNHVILEGEWDLSRKDELTALLATLTRDEPATIDLSGVTYLDSTALNALVMLRLKFNGLPVTLVGPNKSVRRVLKIVNFDKIFQIITH